MSFDPRVSLRMKLKDGIEVLVRVMTPEDRGRIAEAFRQLSPEARYFRFWTRFRELNPKLIEELCSPDHVDHVGWAVFDPNDDERPGLGGASFWRLKDDPAAAEVSFTVADDFQGRGLGTLLLAVLWEHALSLGITRFVGHVLNENLAMRAWWDSLGASFVEYQRQWEMTLLLDEGMLQEGETAQNLRGRLAEVRAAMADAV